MADKEFVNCYNGYGLCLFAVEVREGVPADKLGDKIYFDKEAVEAYRITGQPEGAVVKY